MLIWSLNVQSQVYVNPSATVNGDGSQASPFNDIPTATDAALAAGGGEVIVTDGVHELTNSQRIFTAATAADSIIIRPETPYGVTFDFRVRSAFYFEVESSYITLEGFEIDGKTSEENDFWCVVAEDLWSNFGNPQGGGLGVIANGQHINVYNNYIHDCYQKGVEIADGRYVNVHGNIISNIAQYSLSGGHGIMRQQAGEFEYDDPDVPGTYRWDLYGNLIYNVEQRIYSWVPRKGFMEMVIDEGKSILIDDPKNTNGTQDVMTARIKNNVVAFGAVDHIRLKSTPGLEVSNNSIYSEGANGDGITDKGADPNDGGPETQYTNFEAHGNAVQCEPGIFAIEIDDCLGQSYGSGNDPMGNTPAGVVTNNYVAVGRYKPRNETNVDITDLGDVELFVNPNAGDFTLNPALNLPAGVGVDPAILTELNNRATAFGAPIGNDGWITDNVLLSQTILDNIPGVNDGVVGNELVFTDYGVMDATHEHIDFDVVDGTWKEERSSPAHQEFALNPAYTAWYDGVLALPEMAGASYERLRYGDSYVKQDQVFPSNWLTYSAISSSTENTVIFGYDNDFVTGGDLLVEFKDGFEPQPGQSFELIIAGMITSGVAAAGLSATDPVYFENVLFSGFTPDNYSIDVVTFGMGQALRLNILEVLPVELSAFTAVASGKTTLLDWTTVSETANDYFAVERSRNGQNWTEIGRVEGQGTTAGTSQYNFTDENPVNGDNYYRLKQTDFDGSFAYSPVEIVNFAGAASRVFPNPASNMFTLTTDAEPATIRLIDAAGREVTAQCPITVVEGGLQVNVRALPSGIYFVETGKETLRVQVK